MPVDLTRETTIALRAAQQAGALALSLQGGVDERTKADGTPVSDADLAANEVLCQQLALHFPDDAILSEETADDPARLRSGRLWIVDPIDGTRDYLAGRAGWAVQLALAIDGVLALGVLVIPGEGVSLVGLPGAGGTVITASPAGPVARELALEGAAEGTGASVLIGSGSKRNHDSMTRVRAALPEFASMNATSVGVKVWRMARGEADLYVHARSIAEWDVAAPAAVLLAAGGHATDLAGAPFRFNSPSGRCPGLVFSTRDDHDELIARMRDGGVGLAP